MAENTTQELPQKTFYYHADASPIGGTIHRPFNGFVPSHTSLSLPLVGGFVEKQRKGRPWKNIVTYSNESAHVSGSRKDEANGGPWTTQVSATIEHLNILEVVTADKVVAQLSVAHPFDGGHPTISVVGSQFINLRISGNLIEPVIKYDLFADHDSSSEPDPKKRYPKEAWPKQQKFLDKVKTQLTDAKDAYTKKYDGAPLPAAWPARAVWIRPESGDGRGFCDLLHATPRCDHSDGGADIGVDRAGCSGNAKAPRSLSD